MTEEYKPFDVNSLFGDSSAPAPASPEDVLPHPVAGNESEERLVPTPPEPLASLPPAAPVTKAALALPSAITSDDDGDDVFTPAPKCNPVVEAVKGAGLYIEALGEGRHSLTCPWAAEHAAGAEGQAAYTEPEVAHPFGQFHCAHAHAERRSAPSLIQHLGLTLAEARAKPRIRVSAGDVHRAAGAAERVLAADGRYFHAGGPIVRIINRGSAGVASELVNDQTLTSVLSATIDWERRAPGKEWVRCDPPQNVIQSLRHGQDRLHLPALWGLARQPFYRPDGNLVTSAGFDAETGIFAAFDEADYDLREPTREAAQVSLDYLKAYLEEFEFASDSDKAAALAAMLTAAIRPSLPQAPAFSISATRSGSGKSYLAKIVVLVAGPGDPYNTSYPASAEEATKVVQAMLLERPAVILFDDMQTDWRSFGALNKALTSPTTTERVLGSSRTATARTNVLILGTGNNIEPERDMRRRVVTIRLAPRHDNPALRTFQADPVGQITKHRARVVAAALTIIGAFRAAGSPLTEVNPIGTFETWSALCRQPLLWLGEPDPATSLIDQVTHDSDQELLGEFLATWVRFFGSSPVSVRKILATAAENPDLFDALVELPVMDGKYVNRGRLGWFLRKNSGRRAGGYLIESAESSERRAWRVVAY